MGAEINHFLSFLACWNYNINPHLPHILFPPWAQGRLFLTFLTFSVILMLPRGLTTFINFMTLMTLRGALGRPLARASLCLINNIPKGEEAPLCAEAPPPP